MSVDENYIEFSDKGEETTVAGDVKNYSNLFVIRSVTKFYGMPGIRFGYAIASEDFIDTLQTVRQPWSINGLAGAATLAAFKDTEFIKTSKQTIQQEKAKFSKALNEIPGLQVYPSETNFLLVKITTPKITSTALREELGKEGLLIRDCCTFMGLDTSHFRVTVRSAQENQRLIEALKRKVPQPETEAAHSAVLCDLASRDVQISANRNNLHWLALPGFRKFQEFFALKIWQIAHNHQKRFGGVWF